MSGTVLDKATALKHSVAGSTINKIVCKASSHDLAGPKKKHIDCKWYVLKRELTNYKKFSYLKLAFCFCIYFVHIMCYDWSGSHTENRNEVVQDSTDCSLKWFHIYYIIIYIMYMLLHVHVSVYIYNCFYMYMFMYVHVNNLCFIVFKRISYISIFVTVSSSCFK